ncbi:hypothetical protein Ahy_A07g034630 [Arachis hypogaea]|uniref:Protein FAR1-RELATED SEQUENCE n=1 Tax=Arachis hypogaea TaxID=3818 RepID=A0A445CCC2_ARAHY|nr:hypothetical protein Ahy_A07g034630 [Arachis hypogaea]
MLKFLSGLRSTDCGMFWKYSLDGDKRLQNLFWCDGTSCYDYSVFGDVLCNILTIRMSRFWMYHSDSGGITMSLVYLVIGYEPLCVSLSMGSEKNLKTFPTKTYDTFSRT